MAAHRGRGPRGTDLLSELRFQLAKLGGKRRHLRFETLHADGERLTSTRRRFLHRRFVGDGTAEEVSPAGFLLTGAARLLAHDGVAAGAEALQRGLDVIDRFE